MWNLTVALINQKCNAVTISDVKKNIASTCLILQLLNCLSMNCSLFLFLFVYFLILLLKYIILHSYHKLIFCLQNCHFSMYFDFCGFWGSCKSMEKVEPLFNSVFHHKYMFISATTVKSPFRATDILKINKTLFTHCRHAIVNRTR